MITNENFKLRAVIREEECIGCVKCIKACPYDAILGTGKQMHTVIADECTGCELCVAPCPVDCIDMVPISLDDPTVKQKIHLAEQRKLAHDQRLTKKKAVDPQVLLDRKSYVQAAIARVKMKKRNLR